MNDTPFDRMFFDRAIKALDEVGSGALEFLAANPDISIIDVAKRLNRGASAIGLVMAIYDEAIRHHVVRDVAKDLLIRKVIHKFPNGWSSEGDVHPLVRLGFWEDEIRDYVRDPTTVGYASAIMNHLAIHDSPPPGWKPQSQNDPLIEELFDRYWPVDRIETIGEADQ